MRAGDTTELDEAKLARIEDVANAAGMVPARFVLELVAEVRRLRPDPEGFHVPHPFMLEMQVGGDTWDHVRTIVREYAEMVEDREPESVWSTTGGYGCAGHIRAKLHPEVDPEERRDALQAWMRRRRETKAVARG